MNLNEILNLVLEFLSKYHLWIIIGLVALLLIQIIVSGVVKRRWKRRYKKLTSSFVEKTNEEKTLKEANKHLDLELAEAKKSLENAHGENKENLEKIAELEAKTNVDTVTFEQYESEVSSLKDQLSGAKDEVTRKEEELADLVTKLDESLKTNNEQRSEYEVKCAAHLESLKAANDNIHDLKGEIDALLAKNETLEFDLKVANENISYHKGINEALIKSIKEVSSTSTSTPVRPTKKIKRKIKTEDEKLSELTRAELIKMIERNPESVGTSYKRLSKEKLIEMVKFLNSKKKK